MGVLVRGIGDAEVVAVDAVVEPDVLRDGIGSGVSMDIVDVCLGGGGGGGGDAGDGERVDCTRGGSMSEVGISETSPGFPSSNGESAGGGDDGSIRILFRRGELARNGGGLRSNEAESRALEGAEDVLAWDERGGGGGRDSRSGIRLNVDAFRVCGGDFCVGSRGLEDELDPGPLLEDGSGCRDCSEVCGFRLRDPLGKELGNVLGLIAFDSWLLFCMPLVTGGGSSEVAVEGGESDGKAIPTVDVGLGLPFAPFNDAPFEGVVGGERVFPLGPKSPTLDGREGGLTLGAEVSDEFLECRFDFSQSVRRRLRPTLSDRPCMADIPPAVAGLGSSPPSSFRERAVGVSAPSLD
jgi:hypothetical protein